MGTKRRQQASISLESQTGLFRWYEPALVPGILHTAEYATAVMARLSPSTRPPTT
ncbi:MAG: Scr1 family TA system antitoxin-like transcriptional regulator [Pseudonocardiaceae bacterium]